MELILTKLQMKMIDHQTIRTFRVEWMRGMKGVQTNDIVLFKTNNGSELSEVQFNEMFQISTAVTFFEDTKTYESKVVRSIKLNNNLLYSRA